jgi:hypothetical protein
LSRVNEPDRSPAQPPGGKAGDQGVVFVINGAGATVYYGPQQADDGGTNVTAAGPVTVSGPGGSAAAKGGPAKEGWWARLRKRGMIVAFATIAGAIAAVIGAIVAVCVWTGWTP